MRQRFEGLPWYQRLLVLALLVVVPAGAAVACGSTPQGKQLSAKIESSGWPGHSPVHTDPDGTTTITVEPAAKYYCEAVMVLNTDGTYSLQKLNPGPGHQSKGGTKPKYRKTRGSVPADQLPPSFKTKNLTLRGLNVAIANAIAPTAAQNDAAVRVCSAKYTVEVDKP
jgi:hypothetical protein